MMILRVSKSTTHLSSQFSTRIAEINPLMACISTLFPIIGRVAILNRKVRKVESNSIGIISQTAELKEAIIQWSPPPFIEQSEDPSSKISHALRAAKAYRYTPLYSICIKQFQRMHHRLPLNWARKFSSNSLGSYFHLD